MSKYKTICPHCKRPTTIEMLPNSEQTMRCSYPCAKLFAVRVFKGATSAAKIDWNGENELELAQARAEIERKDKLLSIVGAIANNALYFNDNSDYEKALWELLAAAKPELFAECEMPKLKFIPNEAAEGGRVMSDTPVFIMNDGRYVKEEHFDIVEKQLAEALAEIARKDKLVEQMRGALTKLIGTLEVMSVMPETLGKCPVLAIDAPELEQARAALAAEGGE